MLILAGVSLNAVIGDNGIITQAQNATYMQSVAVLEEFMQQEYLKLYDTLDNPENKIDYFINDTSGSRNYIQKAMNNNYYFMDNVSGNTYYFIEKSALPDEIRNQIKGGDNSLSNKTIWADFTDIYGITSDLKVYYCSNSSDTRIGATDENLQADLSRPIAGMSAGTDWADALGIDRDVTYRDLLSVTDLTITNSNLDLNLMYNLGSLKRLTFKDVEMQNLDGIGNASNLEYIYFNNSKVNNYKGIENCSKLKYLYLYLPPSMSEEDANKQVKNLCDENIGIANADLTNLEYFGIFGVDCTSYTSTLILSQSKSSTYSNLSNVSELSKLKFSKYIKYLFINNTSITSLASLQNFENLYQVIIYNNKDLTSLEGLGNKTKLKYIYTQYCNLSTIEHLQENQELYLLHIKGNESLSSLKGIETSRKLQYLYASNCSLGIYENAEISSQEDALYSLKDNISLKYCDISSNDIKRVEYLSNSTGISELYLDGNINLNGNSLLEIKDIISRCGNNSSVPSKFSLLLLDNNTKNLSLNNQRVNKDNFILIKNKTSMTKLDLSNFVLIDNSNNELSIEETNEIINDVLSTLTGIQYLNLSNINKLNSIQFASNMPNLVEIVLFGTNVITETKDEEGNYTGLEILNNNTKLRGIGLDNENIKLSEIIPTIHRLSRGYVNYTDRFMPLAGLQARNEKMFESLNNSECGLQTLGLNNLAVSSVIDLSQCTTLKNVNLIYGSSKKVELPNSVTTLELDQVVVYGNYPSELEDISFVNGTLDNTVLQRLAEDCPKLKKISTSNRYNITSLDLMKNAVFKGSLETISFGARIDLMPSASNINSVSALSGYKNLKSLSIFNSKITNFDGLVDVSNLQSISIRYNQISSIEGLKNINSLKSVNLENNKIYSLHGLENLKNLQSINLKNNCLQDIIQYTDETGNIKNVSNLSIIAGLHPSNGGALKSVFLEENPNLTDFSLINNLSWTEKSGF